MHQLTFGLRILVTKFGSLKDDIFAAAARLFRTPSFKFTTLRMPVEFVDAGVLSKLLVSFVVFVLFSELLLQFLQTKSQ